MVFCQKPIRVLSVKTTTVQLPDALAQRAASKAKRMGVSQSKILREAIEKGLSDDQTKPSVAELMADLQSSIEGPADALVTYKERFREAVLKKYGKNTR
jgi:hypothetical protein